MEPNLSTQPAEIKQSKFLTKRNKISKFLILGILALLLIVGAYLFFRKSAPESIYKITDEQRNSILNDLMSSPNSTITGEARDSAINGLDKGEPAKVTDEKRSQILDSLQ